METIAPMSSSTASSSAFAPVFGSLKDAIMMGEFEPGRKLRIDEMARTFQTSHMPVREALGQLVVLGALESPPRRSVRLPDVSQPRLSALMDLRLTLESRAVELAARIATSADVAALTGLHARMDEVLARPTLELLEYLRLNHRFHFSVYRIAGNEQLMDMIEIAWLRYGPALNLLRSNALLRGGHDDHLELIEGLRTGDEDRARRALTSDLTNAAQSILRLHAEAAE